MYGSLTATCGNPKCRSSTAAVGYPSVNAATRSPRHPNGPGSFLGSYWALYKTTKWIPMSRLRGHLATLTVTVAHKNSTRSLNEIPHHVLPMHFSKYGYPRDPRRRFEENIGPRLTIRLILKLLHDFNALTYFTFLAVRCSGSCRSNFNRNAWVKQKKPPHILEP